MTVALTIADGATLQKAEVAVPEMDEATVREIFERSGLTTNSPDGLEVVVDSRRGTPDTVVRDKAQVMGHISAVFG